MRSDGIGERRRKSILPGLIASIVAAVSAVSVAFISPIIAANGARLERGLAASAGISADRLAESLSIPAWNLVVREIEVQLALALSDEDSFSAALAFRDLDRPALAFWRDESGNAVPGKAPAAAGLIVERREVKYEGRAIADLELSFTREFVKRRVASEALLYAGILIALDASLVVALILLLRFFIVTPLRRIEQWASLVSLGGDSPLPAGGAEGEIASLRDSISRMVGLLEERYEAMVAREREYRSLFESGPVATWELDFSRLKAGPAGEGRAYGRRVEEIRVKEANAAALRSLGLASPPGRIIDVLGRSEEAIALLAGEIESMESGLPRAAGEVTVALPDGSSRTYAIGFAVLSGHEADWSRVIMTATDLTDRAAAEEGLRRALLEKESLLQELFHRTRNSLQLMASFISLRGARARSADCAAELRDLERRIRTMAMAQEALIKSGDLSQIDLGNYLREVLSSIASEAPGQPGRIQARVEAEPLPTLIDAAVPIGLVAAELATNSVAHAFPGDRRGTIDAVLERRGDGSISLSVRDDGIGTPPGFDPRRDAKLGLETVFALAENQLKGSVAFDLSAGFRCDLRFEDSIFERRV